MVALGAFESTIGPTFVFLFVVTLFLQIWTGVLYYKHPTGPRAYFSLVAAYPELADAFSLGDNLTVCIDGVAVVIGDEGAEEMTEREVKAEIARLSP